MWGSFNYSCCQALPSPLLWRRQNSWNRASDVCCEMAAVCLVAVLDPVSPPVSLRTLINVVVWKCGVLCWLFLVFYSILSILSSNSALWHPTSTLYLCLKTQQPPRPSRWGCDARSLISRVLRQQWVREEQEGEEEGEEIAGGGRWGGGGVSTRGQQEDTMGNRLTKNKQTVSWQAAMALVCLLWLTEVSRGWNNGAKTSRHEHSALSFYLIPSPLSGTITSLPPVTEPARRASPRPNRDTSLTTTPLLPPVRSSLSEARSLPVLQTNRWLTTASLFRPQFNWTYITMFMLSVACNLKTIS